MVMDIILTHRCRNVKDVVNALQTIDKSVTFEEIRDVINELKHDNKISLSEPKLEGSFLNYLTNISRNTSFWLTVLVSMLTLTTIYLMPQTAPWSAIRIISGTIFMLFMPGYALTRLLFPTRDTDGIELVALSIGLSFAVTPLIGLILNYSPWGIRLDPVVMSLTIVSIALAFAASYRRFLLLRKNSN